MRRRRGAFEPRTNETIPAMSSDAVQAREVVRPTPGVVARCDLITASGNLRDGRSFRMFCNTCLATVTAFAERTSSLTLDLSGVDIADSRTVAVIVRLCAFARHRGIQMHVICSPIVWSLLEIYRLTQLAHAVGAPRAAA